MKPILLSEICNLLNIEYVDHDSTMIHHVVKNCDELDNNTLLFHLNYNQELNIEQFNTLTNCFVITDRPFLTYFTIKINHCLYVSDVEFAYRTFTDYYRALFEIPVIAITGTCGKTTTKEMIRQVLEQEHEVVSTVRSKNPIRLVHNYLLSIDEKTEYAVFETAISQPGNLIDSTRFFKPDIGVIMNIGIHHLDRCKTLDNYIRTKGEMLAGLQFKGTLIINGDDENIRKIDTSLFKGVIRTFGFNQKYDFVAKNVEYRTEGMDFTLVHVGKEYPVYVTGIGMHNVYNALAALAVLDSVGKSLEWSIPKLATVSHVRSHMQLYKGINESIIIDDNWGSNPNQMKAALEVLQEKGKEKVKIAVLGRIPHLGDFEEEQYKKIGKMIIDHGVDVIITVDDFAKKIATYACSFGMNPNNVYHIVKRRELVKTLENILNSNSVLLFKMPINNNFNNVILELVLE